MSSSFQPNISATKLFVPAKSVEAISKCTTGDGIAGSFRRLACMFLIKREESNGGNSKLFRDRLVGISQRAARRVRAARGLGRGGDASRGHGGGAAVSRARRARPAG